jgi:actin-related protein
MLKKVMLTIDLCLKLARETTCCSMSFTLPDGQTLRVSHERFWAPEVLFKPHLVGVEAEGLAQDVYNCVQGLPIDERLGLYKSVLVCGGSMMFPGMSTRLAHELTSLYSERVLKVSAFLLLCCAKICDAICCLVYNWIQGLPIDEQLGLYKSVLVCGGSMMFPGMSTRLAH